MKKTSFNGNWIYSATDRISGPILKRVQLPHDASIEMHRDPQEAAGGGNGYFQEQNYIYEKSFTLPDTSETERAVLEFEGVYHNAFVYINQTRVASNRCGYNSFYVDASPYLRCGQENHIRVAVRNALPSSRWYTGGGIYRNVNLFTSGSFHLTPDCVRLTTLDADAELAAIEAEVSVSNSGLGIRRGFLCVELIDRDGKTAAENSVPVTLLEREQKNYRLPLFVDRPALWDDEHPTLYSYRVSLTENGAVVDEDAGTFGIRTLQLDPRRGLRVNGRSVKLRGGCIHHDNGILGAAEFPHAARSRVRAMKEAGYNAIRSSHCPLSKTMLAACDEYGMYVMDELADAWNISKVDFDCSSWLSEEYEALIASLVQKDYNHPCVLMYSIGNEIPELGNPIAAQFGKKLADCFHRLDSRRYVTNGVSVIIAMNEMKRQPLDPDSKNDEAVDPSEINKLMEFLGDNAEEILSTRASAEAVEEAASHLDIMGYNYCARRYIEDQKEYPKRIIVGTETYPKDLDRNWALVEQYPNVIGDFGWAAWDYLGEAGIGQLEYDSNKSFCFFPDFSTKAAYCGDFNLIGDCRPVSWWRSTVWGYNHKPVIAVQPPEHYGEQKLITKWVMTDALRSWNFEGQAGKPVVVEVYSDAEEIELLVNGRSGQRRAVGTEKKFQALFDTVYEPGELTAIAYKNGIETGRDTIRTAGKASLTAYADRETIPADGSDVCYVEIAMRDVDGNLNPEAATRVSIRVEGYGEVKGFGSADPKSQENYFDVTATTFEGRLRAAIRATGKGEIHVILEDENGSHAKLSIQAE